MHILIVPSALYVPNHRSLSGIFQHHQAMALLRGGHKVGVASFGFRTMRHWWEPSGYPDREYPSTNYSITRKFVRLLLPHRLVPPSAIEPYYDRGFRDVISRYIDEHGRPDIIHAHDYVYAGIAASKIGEQRGIPVVVTVHSSDLARKKIPTALIQRACEASANVGATLSVSRALKSILIEMGIKSPLNVVVPNVLDPQNAVQSVRPDVDPDGVSHEPKFNYINIAALDDNKNQALLVQAFRNVVKLKPQSRLTLVGAGKNSLRLRSLVRTLGIDHLVEFVEHLNRRLLFERLSSAQCFVLTSRFETFGVVLIEAASVGVPIISTRCGGPDDIVEETNGILVDCDNVEQLVDAMILMQVEARKYDRATIRCDALFRFGDEAIVRQLEQVYSSVNGARLDDPLKGGD